MQHVASQTSHYDFHFLYCIITSGNRNWRTYMSQQCTVNNVQQRQSHFMETAGSRCAFPNLCLEIPVLTMFHYSLSTDGQFYIISTGLHTRVSKNEGYGKLHKHLTAKCLLMLQAKMYQNLLHMANL